MWAGCDRSKMPVAFGLGDVGERFQVSTLERSLGPMFSEDAPAKSGVKKRKSTLTNHRQRNRTAGCRRLALAASSGQARNAASISVIYSSAPAITSINAQGRNCVSVCDSAASETDAAPSTSAVVMTRFRLHASPMSEAA